MLSCSCRCMHSCNQPCQPPALTPCKVCSEFGRYQKRLAPQSNCSCLQAWHRQEAAGQDLGPDAFLLMQMHAQMQPTMPCPCPHPRQGLQRARKGPEAAWRVCTHAKLVNCEPRLPLRPAVPPFTRWRSAVQCAPRTPCAPWRDLPASKQVGIGSMTSSTPPRRQLCFHSLVLTSPCPASQQCRALSPACRAAPHCAARSHTLH